MRGVIYKCILSVFHEFLGDIIFFFFLCSGIMATSWKISSHGWSFQLVCLTFMRFNLNYICLAIRYGGMANTDLVWNGVLALVPIWENNKYVRQIVTVFISICPFP